MLCVCEQLAEISERTPGSVFELSAQEISSNKPTVSSTVDGKSIRVKVIARTLHFSTESTCSYYLITCLG